MRKNNEKCTSKDCLKPSGLINWIRCDCCSSWYRINCVNFSLSDSKKTQWFQCLFSVDVKSVIKATIGNDLVLDNFVNTVSSLKCPSTQESTKRLACSLGGKCVGQNK